MTAQKNIIAIIVITGLILIVRLYYLQVFDESYKVTAINNAFRYDVEYPARGIIYDRNGNILVENATTYDIMITPRELKNVDTAELCTIFQLSLEEVRSKFKELGKNRGYSAFTFLKQVSPERYGIFREKADEFTGFYSVSRSMRVYPRNVGGNILGYIQEVDTAIINRNNYYKSGDYIGKSGIEEYYEDVLRGAKGVSIYLRDSRNRIVEPYDEGRLDTAAVPGENIVSTIDADLQEYAQRLFVNKRGSAVAIEPSTGEVLALVTAPTFDPSLLSGLNLSKNFAVLQRDPAKPLFNRAIMSSQNPPGSVFKLVNGLIGLDEGVITHQTTYSCDGRYPYGRGVGCHGHFSPVNFEQSIMVSCNSYYCHVFRSILENKKYGSIDSALGIWREKVQLFGFSDRLGIDIPSEQQGILPSKRLYDSRYGQGRWNPLTVISVAIGQGEVGATTLQLANLSATIANRGYYYTPHIIKTIGNGNKVDSKFYEQHQIGIDKEHMEHAVNGMYMAVHGTNGATAWRSQIANIEMCGKTGTSQNPHGENHAVFVCFAPKNDPKIAIAVFVENSGSGGTHAAPIASLMVEKYLTGTVSRTEYEASVLRSDLTKNYDQ